MAVSRESSEMFDKVRGKRQDDPSRQSSSSFNDSSPHLHTSMHNFPDHFPVRRACHLSPWVSVLLHPLPVCFMHPDQQGLALGLRHGPISPSDELASTCKSACYIQVVSWSADPGFSASLPCCCLGAECRYKKHLPTSTRAAPAPLTHQLLKVLLLLLVPRFGKYLGGRWIHN